MEEIKTIPFNPKRITESNICNEMAEIFKSMDIPFYSEYKYDHCIFDGVIFSPIKKEVIAIIEVKRGSKNNDKSMSRFLRGKQYNKYCGVGLPVFFVIGIDNLKKVVYFVVKHLHERKLINEHKFNECLAILKNHKFNRFIFDNK